MIDYLIIGQGFVGSLLSHELLKQGKVVRIIDFDFETSASAISSGILNPITGRNLIKTWRAETFFNFANTYYKELQLQLKHPFYEEIPIFRLMNTAKEENDFSIKSGMEEYEFVLGVESLLDATKYHEQHVFEIKNTKRVGIASVCALLKEEFVLKGIYQNEEFDYSSLKIASDHIVYKDIVSRNIIFCEGAKARVNTYFNHIPFIIAKGEYLVVHIPDLNQKFILNHHKILAPLINNDYWFGATFDWNLNTEMVTEEGRKELIESLDKIIKIPYQIKNHGGAYRPTIKDRRPVIGTHPIYHPLHVFNGFGTKAASLVPYYVTHFIQYLLGNIELEKEVDHRRFIS